MDNYIENSLREMGISTISEFLLFSTHELESMDRIALKIIDNFKKHLIAQISQEKIPQLNQFIIPFNVSLSYINVVELLSK